MVTLLVLLFLFNNVEKWPSLSSVRKHNSACKGMEEGFTANLTNDKVHVAGEGGQDKSMSFAKAVQGLSQNGCNKIRLVPVSVNELGTKFVDLDPVVEEGSKLWAKTLV